MLAQQRQQQFLDMAGDDRSRALGRRAPIQQQRAPAHAGDRRRQRHLFVEIEDVRRVDQRGDEHRRRPAAAMIAQARAANARDFRLRRGRVRPLGVFVSAQPGKRVARQLGIALRGLAHQLEEQGQRTRGRAFMLQRTMLR